MAKHYLVCCVAKMAIRWWNGNEGINPDPGVACCYSHPTMVMPTMARKWGYIKLDPDMQHILPSLTLDNTVYNGHTCKCENILGAHEHQKRDSGLLSDRKEEIYKICGALNFLQMDKTVAVVGSDLCKRKLNLFVFDILMFFPFDISDYSWVDGWPWWTCLSFVFVFCPRQLLKVGGWSESESGAHPLQLIGF